MDIFANDKSITAITGSNGAGKTSLALILSGLEKLKKGNIYLHGERAGCRKLRKDVYYCSNDTVTQFFTNSVSEELLLNMKQNKKTICDAKDLLKRMDLYKYKDVHPQSLSGGQRQRLAVCCALLSEKKILIFDEPTSGLDPVSRDEMNEIFRKLAEKGVAILFSTHITSDLEKCADTITYIKNGELLLSAKKEDFIRYYTKEMDGAPTLEDIMVHIEREEVKL